jgi:hypothetical protein
MKLITAILTTTFLGMAAHAEEDACPSALIELEFALKGSELPSATLVKEIESSCPKNVSELVSKQVEDLQIAVLTTQVAFLDANRLESYQQLEAALDAAGNGKKRAGNQAFGTALLTLRPVLAVHLERNLYD